MRPVCLAPTGSSLDRGVNDMIPSSRCAPSIRFFGRDGNARARGAKGRLILAKSTIFVAHFVQRFIDHAFFYML